MKLHKLSSILGVLAAVAAFSLISVAQAGTPLMITESSMRSVNGLQLAMSNIYGSRFRDQRRERRFRARRSRRPYYYDVRFRDLRGNTFTEWDLIVMSRRR